MKRGSGLDDYAFKKQKWQKKSPIVQNQMARHRVMMTERMRQRSTPALFKNANQEEIGLFQY